MKTKDAITTIADKQLGELTDLILPGAGGRGVVVVLRELASERGRRAPEILSAAREAASPAERTSLDLLATTIGGLPAHVLTMAMSSPLASFDLPAPESHLESIRDPRDALTVGLALARHVVGLRELDGVTVLLPPRTFTAGPLYMPHLHCYLSGGKGPVAATTSGDLIRLTWEDGFRATMPLELKGEISTALSWRLAPCSQLAGRAIYNSCSEVVQTFEPFDLADQVGIRSVASANWRALGLLRRIWPAAAEMTDQFLAGFLFLQPRFGTRSHTSPRLTGVVLTSAAEPVQAADILCHELAHVRMNIILERDRLLLNDEAELYESPWRRDRRPLIGVFLGVHAFLNVCHFYRRLDESGESTDSTNEIYNRQREKVHSGWQTLRAAAIPTPLGTRVLDSLQLEVEAL